ncbi:hypothetical protein KKA93_00935 [Patescibacteria group bacterium]|nr:hypothetical protein [Patescibacteria group bacterium]MBU1663488.1 hypothetical protein [Patescibacteria group bacterium]MBU1933733.1 hypothetical protein [Patescibacteria group bacterium]MBU2007599.1 hypothetical protein [Patescibacteria group bacterium]MBU2233589.1 hypothetical protein [Patescibacteria group bacterium]
MNIKKIQQITKKHLKKIKELKAKQSKLVKVFFEISDKADIEKIRNDIKSL